jgi:CRISPR-associated protein Csh1
MDFFENSHESVLEKITEVTKDNPKELYIFTLKINNKFIGKSELFDIVRETASEEIYSSYYTQDKKVIEGLNSTCSICRQQNKTVWGYVSTYNFYTSKTEFAPIAGGFKKEKAHLNYPVCPECAQKLESFKPVIEKYFRFKFCGLDYFLIPEFIIQDKSNDSLQNVLTVFTELDNENSTRLGKLSLGKDKPILEGAKNEVFNYLASAKNSANYTMLFFVENNAEFKVLMTVENVFPSQFNEILNAKTSADSHSVFHNLRGVIKDTEANLEFKFELLKEFFPINSKIYGDFTKSFLEIVRAVFIQKKLSYPFILDRIMKVVRTRFVRDEYWEISVRKSLLTMEFLLELGIIEIKKGNFKEVELNSKYESFFDEHCDVFTSNATKAVFLIGVLCQFLLNIQQNDRHAQPFRKKLNSLKMSPVLIRKIYPEIIEKLEQYGKNYYRELEGDISNLLVKEKLEILTNDEISFYFVMGMTLSKDFKLTKNNEEGEENA